MHTKDDRARCARYAFLAIFIYTFAAGLAIGLLNGPRASWPFYVAGAFVGALLAVDVWIKVREERSDRRELDLERLGLTLATGA